MTFDGQSRSSSWCNIKCDEICHQSIIDNIPSINVIYRNMYKVSKEWSAPYFEVTPFIWQRMLRVWSIDIRSSASRFAASLAPNVPIHQLMGSGRGFSRGYVIGMKRGPNSETKEGRQQAFANTFAWLALAVGDE